jgi:hypothetical protein
VLLIGMRIPPNYGQEYTQQFAGLFVRIAKSQQVALLPFFLEGVAQRNELFQADRIHPNEAAQSDYVSECLDCPHPVLWATDAQKELTARTTRAGLF